jgi:LysM repeat protein
MKRLMVCTLIALSLLLSLGAATVFAADEAYVVQPGDTLLRIAARNNVSVSQLANANGLRWNSWIYVGQRLTIPGSAPASAPSSSSGTYVVRSGDTLLRIAARHGVSVSQLASANGLSWYSWVYAGQRLVIPGRTAASTAPSGTTSYIVRRGDTLSRIAARHGISASSLARANGLRWNAWVYVGQRLTIPGQASSSAPQSTSRERWIDVNLSTQTLTAYEGSNPVYRAVVSTGLPGTPTPVGTFRVWIKLRYDDMSGPGYYLPNVPYVMYFYRDYGLHGTYWHSNFGTPMSHGCVNLSTPEAGWLYNWASVGTRVVTHY